VTLQIDDDTAHRLFGKCKSELAWIKGRSKESPVTEKSKLHAFGVPCIIDFGFVLKNVASRSQIHTCVWIFSDCSSDFFGSCYLPVKEDAHAPVILNQTIVHAIEHAKTNQKFKELQAAIAAGKI